MTTRGRLLLVEDDPDDVMLLRQALEGARAPVELVVARDGLEALACLRRGGSSAASPALALLDWRLPGKSGLEVLREIRADAALRLLPVIVFTTSTSEKDVVDAYGAGANCYLTKPTGLDAMLALVSSLVDFWLRRARLPPAPMC